MPYWPAITDDTNNTTTIMDVPIFLSLKNKDDNDNNNVSLLSPKLNQQQSFDTAFNEKISVENKSLQEDNNQNIATSLTANNIQIATKSKKEQTTMTITRSQTLLPLIMVTKKKTQKNWNSAAINLDTIPLIEKLMEY